MGFGLLTAAVAGIATVVQAGLNRSLGERWGLAWALVVNSMVVLIFSLVFWGITRVQPQWFSPFFHATEDASREGLFEWKALIPGLCGFLIVLGIPFAIPRLGAVSVFLAVVAFQLLMSLAWDAWIEKVPFAWSRVLGVGLAFVGVWLASRK